MFHKILQIPAEVFKIIKKKPGDVNHTSQLSLKKNRPQVY
jgi:hypothetical protein